MKPRDFLAHKDELMGEKSIEVLAIAPYPAMAELFEKIAGEYPTINLDVHVGDLESGLAVALKAFRANYDLVISRGGTAQVLGEELAIPIIEVELSTIDVMRQVREMLPDGGRAATVGFESALTNLIHARDLLDASLDIFPVEFADEVPLVMDQVREGGYDLVLCDTISYQVAKGSGINARLLESGPDSVRNALDRAVSYCSHWKLERKRSRMLWQLIQEQSDRLVIYLRAGGLVFSNLEDDDYPLYPFLESHLGDTRSRRLAFRNLGRVYRIKPIRLGSSNDEMVAYGISLLQTSARVGLGGIEYQNESDVRQLFEGSFFARTKVNRHPEGALPPSLAANRPLLLSGEVGTGKEQIARMAYLDSEFRNRPFVQIDCELLGPRSIRFLTQSYRSPLFEGDQTIFLRGIQALDYETWRSILAVMLESGLVRRSRLMVAGNLNQDGSEPEVMLAFAERLKCIAIDIPALRTMPETIASDTRHYLEAVVTEMGDEVPGLTAEAIQKLEGYSWPRNYFQLQRVLDRLLEEARTQGSMVIDGPAVHDAIIHESYQRASDPSNDGSGIDILRPLSETERDIARAALARCDGNRTQAAELLGISRTTMWRLLKDDVDDA